LNIFSCCVIGIATSVVEGVICKESSLTMWMGGYVIDVERKKVWDKEAETLGNAGADASDRRNFVAYFDMEGFVE